MDGESVEGEPSIEYSTFTEVFIKLCPYYMEMGMSYYDYWHMNTSCHKAYREAYKIHKRNEEWARWRQAAYIFDALLCASPMMKPFVKDAKPGKFPEEPWPLTQKEADERQEAKDSENYKKALAQRRAASDAEKKRRQEEAERQEASEDGRD